tara:strand:+ start:55471 stop:55680 length:210 start_codon:yes stop_codon:yes gene_type:complete
MFFSAKWDKISVPMEYHNGIWVESKDPREMNGVEYFRHMWSGVIDESGLDENGRDCFDEVNNLRNGKRL